MSKASNGEDSPRTGAPKGIIRPNEKAAPLILHVRPEPAGYLSAGRIAREDWLADRMDAILESASLRAVSCPNVYQGLARLLKTGPQTPTAVLLCVDDLDRQELEFFSIVSRLRPTRPVYVYSEGPSEPKIAKAIELGAAGLATEETIRALKDAAVRAGPQASDALTELPGPAPRKPITAGAFAVAAPTLTTEKTATTPQPASGDNAVDVPAAEAQPVSTPSQVYEEAQPACEEEAEKHVSDTPVPVPWLRRTDGPVRTAPQRHPPTADKPGGAGPAASEPTTDEPLLAEDEPLLTDEELRALMGEDDIAAIAPEERDPDAPDSQPGGGARP